MQNFLLALRPLPIARLAFGIFDLTRPVHWGQLLSQASLVCQRWDQCIAGCVGKCLLTLTLHGASLPSAAPRAGSSKFSARSPLPFTSQGWQSQADVEARVIWSLRPWIPDPWPKCVRRASARLFGPCTLYTPPQVPQMRQVGAGRGPSSLPAN